MAHANRFAPSLARLTLIGLAGLLTLSCSGGIPSGECRIVDDPEGRRFTSIQAAIDAAPAWGEVRVGPGLFRERLVVSKPLTLTGSGWKTRVESPYDRLCHHILHLRQQCPRQTYAASLDPATAADLDRLIREWTAYPRPTLLVRDTGGVTIQDLLFAQDRFEVTRGVNRPGSVVTLVGAQARLARCAVIRSTGSGIGAHHGSRLAATKVLVAAMGTHGVITKTLPSPSAEPDSTVILRSCTIRNVRRQCTPRSAGSSHCAVDNCTLTSLEPRYAKTNTTGDLEPIPVMPEETRFLEQCKQPEPTDTSLLPTAKLKERWGRLWNLARHVARDKGEPHAQEEARKTLLQLLTSKDPALEWTGLIVLDQTRYVIRDGQVPKSLGAEDLRRPLETLLDRSTGCNRVIAAHMAIAYGFGPGRIPVIRRLVGDKARGFMALYYRQATLRALLNRPWNMPYTPIDLTGEAGDLAHTLLDNQTTDFLLHARKRPGQVGVDPIRVSRRLQRRLLAHLTAPATRATVIRCCLAPITNKDSLVLDELIRSLTEKDAEVRKQALRALICNLTTKDRGRVVQAIANLAKTPTGRKTAMGALESLHKTKQPDHMTGLEALVAAPSLPEELRHAAEKARKWARHTNWFRTEPIVTGAIPLLHQENHTRLLLGEGMVMHQQRSPGTRDTLLHNPMKAENRDRLVRFLTDRVKSGNPHIHLELSRYTPWNTVNFFMTRQVPDTLRNQVRFHLVVRDPAGAPGTLPLHFLKPAAKETTPDTSPSIRFRLGQWGKPLTAAGIQAWLQARPQLDRKRTPVVIETQARTLFETGTVAALYAQLRREGFTAIRFHANPRPSTNREPVTRPALPWAPKVEILSP